LEDVEGIGAKLEKIVIPSNLSEAKHLLPDASHLLLFRTGRRLVGGAS